MEIHACKIFVEKKNKWFWYLFTVYSCREKRYCREKPDKPLQENRLGATGKLLRPYRRISYGAEAWSAA